MLLLIQQIGSNSVLTFWVPVLTWTALAGAAALCLGLVRGLHPLSGYRLRQALLLALPASILAAPWVPGLSLPVVRAPALERLGPTHTSVSAPTAAPAQPAGVDGAMMPTVAHPWTAGPPEVTTTDAATMLLGAAVTSLALMALVRLSMLALAARRLYQLGRAAPRLDHPSANRILRELAEQLQIRRPVEVREGPPKSTPVTFGARRPVVLVPRSLLESPDSLKTVLIHELIHVRRHDHVWTLLDCLTAAVFGFHPLVWWLRRGIQHCRETSCDAEVLSAGKVPAARYARLLVRTHAGKEIAIDPLVASMLVHSSSLKRRLEIMRRFAESGRRLQRHGAVVAASICLFAGMALVSGAATVGAAQAELEPGDRFTECPDCPEMVVVPAGSFLMGSPDSEAWRTEHEGPRYTVRIERPFAVGVHEVTFEEWDACVQAGGCDLYEPDDEGWGRGKRPVINVHWEDARAYAEWLTDQTGNEYRLPTEAEWEYVARAGTQTSTYWGEENYEEQCRYANGYDATAAGGFSDMVIPCQDGHAYTAPVGSYLPNEFGLHDVLGNVREWVDDCWSDSYEGAPTDGSKHSTGNCSTRVARGGGWNVKPAAIRSAWRGKFPAPERFHSHGLRLVRDLD